MICYKNRKVYMSLLASALLCCSILPVAAQDAQTSREKAKAAQAAAESAREAAEKRVEDDMVRMNDLVEALSKNLGQLHYLRTLCFGENDQIWREKTAEMMDIEVGDDADRRRALIRAFNAGYYEEKDRFSTCSKGVGVDAAALSENARNIAAMLGDPFREP